MKKITWIIVGVLFNLQTAHAIEELSATPSVLSEPDATILITEVSFKNKQNDFAVLTYNSPSNKPANLKNLTIKDDGKVLQIENDFIVASGQEILLTWNTDQPNDAPYLYTTKKGLTGTTEQLIIYDQNDEILDMVCWTNDSPTETEIEDFTEAYEQNGWASQDISSCVSSEIISTDESIKRKPNTDTDSANDWILPEQPVEEDPIETPDLITITIPQPTETSTDTATSNSTSNFTNGSLSSDIIISEILPNPDGSDSGKEWIELFNQSATDINLGNWILDDNEDGSKPYTLPDSLIIKSNQAILINCKAVKLSLGNSEDSVRLFDYQGQLVSEVQYESAPSAESYSLIEITDEEGEVEYEYQWTAEPTPGEANPQFQQLIITVETEPVFENEYFFTALNSEQQSVKIIFTEDIIAAPLAKATFTKGTKIRAIVEETDNANLQLISYETIGTDKINNDSPNFLLPILLGFLIMTGGTLYFVMKKINWQTDKKTI